MYRNTNTGEIWTLEEIKEAYEKFGNESSLTFEEVMQDFEEIDLKGATSPIDMVDAPEVK